VCVCSCVCVHAYMCTYALAAGSVIPDKSLNGPGFSEGIRDGSVVVVKWHYGITLDRMSKVRPGKDATIVLFRWASC